MTIQEEDTLKRKFITQMDNKYDYLLFKNFCIDMGFEITPFVVFAGIVEPMLPPTGMIVSPLPPKPCNTCGGGKVL